MKRHLKNNCCLLFVIGLLAACFSACDNGPVFEKEGNCVSGVSIRFVYDYNMEYANAFHNQVDCIDVFIYDSEGKFVTALYENTEILRNENYRMTVDLPEGTYNIVAFGGTNCDRTSFGFDTHPSFGGDRHTTFFELNDEEIGNELHPLFYGTCENINVPEPSDSHTEVVVRMLKDTNSVRVLLQQISGRKVDYNDFEFKLIADNKRMRHDNKVILGNKCGYTPWTYGNENPGELPGNTPASVAWGEFSIGRIVDESEVSDLNPQEGYEGPRLEVTLKEDNRTIISIPLIEYLLLCKPASSTKAESMSDQEFLDRESRYRLFFFLNENMDWVSLRIEVASWVVRVTNKEFN